LDRRILDIRLVAMLLIFLVASVALSPTWSPTQVQASGNAPCTGCGQKAITSQNVTLEDVIVLEGEERNKAIVAALSSQDYKNVKEALIKRGYTPLVDNATAQIAKLLFNGTEVELLTVLVPFKGEADFWAGIIFAALENRTAAIGGISNVKNKTALIVVSINGQLSGEVVFSSSGYVVSLSQYEECMDDTDCKPLYGPEFCCYDGYCDLCPGAPPPPPPPGYECFWDCLWCLIETGVLIKNCWPCFIPCLFIFTFWTCVLCLLTYCVIANIWVIIDFASWVASCLRCARCMGWIP